MDAPAEECGVVAQAIMRERLRDRVEGADHYCTSALWKAEATASWSCGAAAAALDTGRR